MSEFIEIIDRHGRRRRARKGEVLADGERFSLSMQFMDAAARETADHLAAKYGAIRVVDAAGVAAGHRPGFLHDSASAHLHDAAAIAYEQRNERMRRAWRHNKGEEHRDAGDCGERHARTRTPTSDELDLAATAAYAARSKWMSEGWRRR
jgi:hypothetical protein